MTKYSLADRTIAIDGKPALRLSIVTDADNRRGIEPPQADELIRKIVGLLNEGDEIRASLTELTDWMRDNTSPLDQNTPHESLVRAMKLLGTWPETKPGLHADHCPAGRSPRTAGAPCICHVRGTGHP
jgi:hypothetical protein